MNVLRQIGAVVALSFRSLPQRRASSAVTVIGIAAVVVVLLSMLSLSTSLVRAISGMGNPNRAMVIEAERFSEGASSLPREATVAILNAPGIRRTSAGKPIASMELVTIAPLRLKSDGTRAEALFRGVDVSVLQPLRPEIKLIAGRFMRSGLNEIAVGRAAQGQYGLSLGDRITVRGVSWSIVGVFESAGDARESELLTDTESLRTASKQSTYSAVTVLLDDPGAFQRFKNALTLDPTLFIRVLAEPEYYQQQSQPVRTLFSLIAYVVGGIMAVGAMFGALNTMSSAVSSRSREIATLRALGFNATSVVCAVLAEALFLGLLGAALGATLVWLMISGNTFSTRVEDGAVVVQLQITAGLLLTGITWACVIGAIGGLVPGIRVARMPVVRALREI